MTQRENTAPRFGKRGLLALCAGICAVTVALVLNMDPYDHRILPNVRIGGVDVGGMTRPEAEAAMESTAQRFAREELVLRLPEEELRLSPADTGAVLDVPAAVDAAYDYGRTGTKEEKQAAYETAQSTGQDFGLLPWLQLDDSAILNAIRDYANRYDTDYAPFSYALEGVKPELAEDAFDPSAPCQTLVLTMGTPGVKLDVDALWQQVLEAYDSGRFLVELPQIVPEAVPAAPDLAAVYMELYSAPKDSALDLQTCEFIPGSYGYRFDFEKAQTLADNAAFGETLRIPMEIVEPELLGEEVYYRDVLGEYHSGFSGRLNIQTNLQLVCDFLNGVVLQPGETFSYNDCIGERTVERGFLYGESFTGTSESRSPGGGVCQGSSMLYVCTLLADLEIVERVCHGIQVSYTPPGQDAAVSYGETDFRFRNNTGFPLKIEAWLTYQAMHIQLLGTDNKDYYIELESTFGHGKNLSYANCYQKKFDKETGELLSRDLASHSAYLYNGD